MRIKIKGEITAERLVEAVMNVQAQLPGCKLFSAQLYINAVNSQGLVIERDAIHTFEAPSKTVVDVKTAKALRTIENKNQWLILNSQTAELMASMPDRFVSGLNTAVCSAWNTIKPFEDYSGKDIPKPVFSACGNILQLASASWVPPSTVANPIHVLKGDSFATFWSNDAWMQAVHLIQFVMRHLLKDLVNEMQIANEIETEAPSP